MVGERSPKYRGPSGAIPAPPDSSRRGAADGMGPGRVPAPGGPGGPILLPHLCSPMKAPNLGERSPSDLLRHVHALHVGVLERLSEQQGGGPGGQAARLRYRRFGRSSGHRRPSGATPAPPESSRRGAAVGKGPGRVPALGGTIVAPPSRLAHKPYRRSTAKSNDPRIENPVDA